MLKQDSWPQRCALANSSSGLRQILRWWCLGRLASQMSNHTATRMLTARCREDLCCNYHPTSPVILLSNARCRSTHHRRSSEWGTCVDESDRVHQADEAGSLLHCSAHKALFPNNSKSIGVVAYCHLPRLPESPLIIPTFTSFHQICHSPTFWVDDLLKVSASSFNFPS
jgi:hypothetical protein